MKRKILLFAAILTLSFELQTLNCYSQPGCLDVSFGSGGKVLTDVTTDFVSNNQDYSSAVAIQTDGKILVAGKSYGDQYNFALARYTTTGSLDNTFGTGGKVTRFPNDGGHSVAIQTDGKILVAGTDIGVGYDFVLARYTTTGNLDTTFGTGGKITTDFGGYYDFGNSVAIQTDGKILVVGYSGYGAYYDFALARYDTTGSLDNTFSSDGRTTTGFGSDYATGYSVAIQTDGKILVAGRSYNGSWDFALARYTATGSLDSTFGIGGKTTTAIGSGDDPGNSVAIQTDGKILVAGWSYNGSWDFALARYDTTGSLDTTFDLDGKTTTDFGNSSDYGYSVAIQTDGKILVAGVSGNTPVGTNADFALARYTTTGSLDTTFCSGGKLTTDFGSSSDYGYSVAIQTDGKILVAGVSGRHYSDFALARYNGCTTSVIVSLSLNPDTVCLNTGAYALTGGSPGGGTYSGDGVSAGNFNPSTAGPGLNNIIYTYTDGNNCTNSDIAQLFVDVCSGIQTASENQSISIFPNPTSGKIQLIGNQYSVTGLEIYNLTGEKVFESTVNRKQETVNLSSQPNGIYFLTIRTEQGTVNKKIIINK